MCDKISFLSVVSFLTEQLIPLQCNGSRVSLLQNSRLVAPSLTEWNIWAHNIKSRWFDNWIINFPSTDPHIWLHGLFCRLTMVRSVSITEKEHWGWFIQAGGFHFTVPNFNSCLPILCVSACAHAFVCLDMYLLDCICAYLPGNARMTQWGQLCEHRTYQASLLVRVGRCGLQSPAAWPPGLFAQQIRASHAMSPGCHSDSVIILSCKECNSRFISCITKSPEGFGWGYYSLFTCLCSASFSSLSVFF